MSSVQSLRDFICQRLTAAAAEIFTEFEKTIEEEIDRQRGLLESSWKQQINTNTITDTTDDPQQSVWKQEEEVLADLHLFYVEKNSSREQNQPEPPQIKEEQEELFSTNEEEQLVLNQDTETSVLLQNTSRCEETLELTPQDLNQNQEVVSGCHRLLGINFNPEIRLCRIDLPQQQVCKEEEVLSDQQLWNQERNSSLDQQEPELPQMKEEQEELCSSQEGEQLVLEQETDTFMMTPTDQEPDLSEAEPITEQLYSHDSPLTERTSQEESQNLDSGSTTDVEMNPKKNHSNRNSQFLLCDSSQDHSYVLQTELDTESGKKAFKCDFCGRIFRSKSYMLYHYKIHTGEKMYECKTCNKAFAQKSGLLKHTRIHGGEKPFTCKTCGKAFTHKCTLRKHTRIHSGENPYECKICGKTFPYSSNLLGHTRVHTGEKPFQCKTCEKTFAHNSSLLKHTRIHTGEKPFKCKTCGKAFTQSVTLLVHTRTHTGEKPFECKTCGKAFTHKCSLMKHTRIHSGENPYQCKTCGKTFSYSSSLLVHARVHTGEKPFQCKTCAKTFAHSSSLLKHTRIHTGEKPYKCETCGKAFLQKAALLQHSKIHTRGHVLVENTS